MPGHYPIRLETAPGAYSTIPVWQSREAFLVAVDSAVEATSWRAPRRAGLRAVLEALASFADHRTGRGVEVAVDTIARHLSTSRRTVQRRLADARELGLLVDVDRGRHLYRAERQRLRGRSITKTSTRALTHKPVAVTPPGARQGTRDSSGERNNRTRKRVAKAPRSMKSQRLAARLDRRYPWLTGSRHIGALVDILEKAGVAGWHERDVVEAIDGWHERAGWTSLGRDAKNPLGWFSMALRRSLQDGAESRWARSLEDRAQARLRAQQRAAQRAEEQAQAASPEVAARFLAEIRASLSR